MKMQFIRTTLGFSLAVLTSVVLMFSSTVQAGVKIQHWQTKAGTEVYFVENHDLPIVDVSVNFAAGSARDTAEKSGQRLPRRWRLLASSSRCCSWVCRTNSLIMAMRSNCWRNADSMRQELRHPYASEFMRKSQGW